MRPPYSYSSIPVVLGLISQEYLDIVNETCCIMSVGRTLFLTLSGCKLTTMWREAVLAALAGPNPARQAESHVGARCAWGLIIFGIRNRGSLAFHFNVKTKCLKGLYV